jgi:hypothetical protein
MKAGLDAAGLKPYLMVQPLAFHTPDAGITLYYRSRYCSLLQMQVIFRPFPLYDNNIIVVASLYDFLLSL